MTALQVTSQKQLKQLVEQLERLEAEKAAIGGDIRDKYLEAKGVGFDVKALRKTIARRKKAKNELQEEDSLIDLYQRTLDGTLAEVEESVS